MLDQLTNFYYKAENLYWAHDLPGENLVQLLKGYHGYMVHIVHQNSGLNKTICRIIHVITGFFAYPFFGLFAALGMVGKLFGIPGVKTHNEAEKVCFGLNLRSSRTDCIDYVHLNWRLGSEIKNIYQVHTKPIRLEDVTDVTENKLLEKLGEDIDFFTVCYEKIYLNAQGSWEKGITIDCMVLQSKSPFCARNVGIVKDSPWDPNNPKLRFIE